MALRREEIPAFTDSFIEDFNRTFGPDAEQLYEQSVYFALDKVRRAPGVEYIRIGRHDFYHSSIGLGLYHRIGRFESRPRSQKRQSLARRPHDHDLGNGLLVCSTEDIKAASGAYLEQYPNGSFVCAIGSRTHEQVVFIRRLDGNPRRKDIRVYNCNWFVPGCSIITKLCRIIDCERGVYHSAIHRRENINGICGALSWCEIALHFWTMTCPFQRMVALYHFRNHTQKIN